MNNNTKLLNFLIHFMSVAYTLAFLKFQYNSEISPLIAKWSNGEML